MSRGKKSGVAAVALIIFCRVRAISCDISKIWSGVTDFVVAIEGFSVVVNKVW